MKATALLLSIGLCTALGIVGHSAWAVEEEELGATVFVRACAACHSFKPNLNMTGPSLAGVWGRKAGTLQSFDRYSPALKSANVTWNAGNLDQWLKNPAQFIPQSRMTFRGIPDPQSREDVIAYLKKASSIGAGKLQTSEGGNMSMGGMMGSAERPNLKKIEPAQEVKAIRQCRDTYHITTGDGETHDFWEPNLRFKTDSSNIGPPSGTPALLPAGMMGDRADIIFAKPEEMSGFIKHEC
jgi:cytochrome c